MRRRNFRRLLALGLLLTAGTLVLAGGRAASAATGSDHYRQTNLVSDLANPPGGPPAHVDSNLVNPWGIATGPTTPLWVSDNGAGVSTVYNGAGQTVRPPVAIPAPQGSPPGSTGTPTAVVFNVTPDDFPVSENGSAGKALFIWATEDGTIAGWSPSVDANNAIIAVDNSQHPTADNGAVYKGLALANFGGAYYLYATNFRAGTVDVFDATFHQVHLPGSFIDPFIPAGFAPFGIQAISGNLYVTYAKQDAEKHDDVAGPGNGFVDVFSPSGRLAGRFASQGPLNSPWGVVVAPAGFGRFSNDILVGNFGDGRITAYSRPIGVSGMLVGQLQDPTGQPLAIHGLWGLLAGNGSAGSNINAVYFAAGIDHESHGLFGALTAATP